MWLHNYAEIPNLLKLAGLFQQQQLGRILWKFGSICFAKTPRKGSVSKVQATEVVPFPVFISFVVKQQTPPTHVLFNTMRRMSLQSSFGIGKFGKVPEQ